MILSKTKSGVQCVIQRSGTTRSSRCLAQTLPLGEPAARPGAGTWGGVPVVLPPGAHGAASPPTPPARSWVLRWGGERSGGGGRWCYSTCCATPPPGCSCESSHRKRSTLLAGTRRPATSVCSTGAAASVRRDAARPGRPSAWRTHSSPSAVAEMPLPSVS